MAYNRRRRVRGIWFPTAQNPATTSITIASGVTPGPGDANYATAPLIAGGLDLPANLSNLTAGTNLTGALGLTTRGAYLTKRIVGNIWYRRTVGSFTSATPREGFRLFAGIFVDRVTSNGTLANQTAWNPFTEDSIQKRWLFRRFWSDAENAVATVGNPTNANANNVRDSSFIDCKAKARVSYEERLFLMVGMWQDNAQEFTYKWEWNLRMFATAFQGGSR